MATVAIIPARYSQKKEEHQLHDIDLHPFTRVMRDEIDWLILPAMCTFLSFRFSLCFSKTFLSVKGK